MLILPILEVLLIFFLSTAVGIVGREFWMLITGLKSGTSRIGWLNDFANINPEGEVCEDGFSR